MSIQQQIVQWLATFTVFGVWWACAVLAERYLHVNADHVLLLIIAVTVARMLGSRAQPKPRSSPDGTSMLK